ncbi:MAG: MFS transporter [Candidatus Aminicenantes bacterium]|nr:MFS transporter [Candidatus Aminicenantes bacterium]
MAKNLLNRVLSRFVEIKPGEEVIASLLFLYLFLIMFPYYIIKPYRDAKYLIELTSARLPYAYLLTALFMGFFVHFYTKLQVRIQRRVLIISSVTFFALTCLLSRWLFNLDLSWMPLAFWVWANTFVVVLITQFWILVNDIFNPREVKRLIGFFGSGGLFGGILGGLLTGLLGRDMPDIVLIIASGLLVLSIFVVNHIFIWQRKKSPPDDKVDHKHRERGAEQVKVGFIDCFNTVRKNYYLKLLAGVVTLTFIVSTFIDWQSKTVIDIKIERMDEKLEFFGFFHAALLVIPFFISIFMSSNILKRYGIRVTLLLFPLVLLLCIFGIGYRPEIFVFALAIKAGDKSLSFSINQYVRELLYIPISPELKYKAKVFIDMFLNRFAKGVGALILLFLVYIFLPPENWQWDWRDKVQLVSIIAVIFIGAWLLLNLKVSKEYTNIVKQKLDVKWDRGDRLVAEKMDVDYTKLVFDTIESRERSSVLYAMHLYDLIKQDKLTPEVRKLISYKADERRVASLGGLFESGETTLIPETDDMLGEEVLEKEVQEIMSLDVYQEVMKGYIDKVLVDKTNETKTSKMEVAKAIGLMESDSPLAQKLEELLEDESPEVSKYAIESAARLKRRELVPGLIYKLDNPLTREDASAALEKYGERIVGTLSDYLGDYDEDVGLRKEVASVLARIPIQDSADLLAWELAEENEDMDNELIDALDRIRSGQPDIQVQAEIIKTKIFKEIKRYYQILINSYETKSEVKRPEMSGKLSEDLAASMMNIFKLLGLIYPHEDIFRAYQNIRTATKDSIDYAVELLDNILPKDIRDVIFPLIEDLSLEERVKKCRVLFKAFPKMQ